MTEMRVTEVTAGEGSLLYEVHNMTLLWPCLRACMASRGEGAGKGKGNGDAEPRFVVGSSAAGRPKAFSPTGKAGGTCSGVEWEKRGGAREGYCMGSHTVVLVNAG